MLSITPCANCIISSACFVQTQQKQNISKVGLDVLREYVLFLSHKAKPAHERRNTPPKQNDILREYVRHRKGEAKNEVFYRS